MAAGPLCGGLTPELRAEIERHLRVNPVRHGEVFRALERGLDVDQMGISRSHARDYIASVNAMLTGTLPRTRSAALINSYGYRYLLTRDLSPALHHHVKKFLRRLAEINPEVRVDKPLQLRALPGSKAPTTQNQPTPEDLCPACHLVHAGDCD